MYFGVTSLLHPGDYSGPFYLSSTYTLFVGSNFAFIFLAWQASLVYENSRRIGGVALEMLTTEKNPTTAQERFVLIAEKGLSLNVWKMTPMMRSFMFGKMGTVLTYSILFDSLQH
ncbi:hypothetical protein AVEN_118876-1 [Araneus ventricosus]|uniref:Uncharacterized protein n=1 Tax=Araneus ventricosus TaxID=182803 RepID=A0A4Y2J2I9_ARAVE|nr:hypothetical protein AVEN_118876-1 [Araneus ventricosus]